MQGLTVELKTGSRRLLLSTVSLSVQSVTISTNRDYLTILTNYYPTDVWTSTISINFQAGTLITSTGSSYSQLTGTMSLSSPAYLNTYYSVFSTSLNLQIEGMVFTGISLLLFLSSLFLKSARVSAECMSLVSMVQIFGLARVKDFPFSFEYYNSLVGYSFYELRNVGNPFTYLFMQSNYSETAIDSAVFVFGSQNFLLNFGTLFLVFLGLELLLLGYLLYIQIRGQQAKLPRFQQLQDHLVYFWANIILFGSLLTLLSLQNNSISSANYGYAFSILLSFAIVAAYCFYFHLWVRSRLATDLYKLNNLFRIAGLLLLAHNYNSGILLINFSELFFWVADLRLHQEDLSNRYLYSLERGCFWVGLNAAMLKVESLPLLVVAGGCFGIISVVKGYYVVRRTVDVCAGKGEETLSRDCMGGKEGANRLQSQNQSMISELGMEGVDKDLNYHRPFRMESLNTLVEPPAPAVIFAPDTLNQVEVEKALTIDARSKGGEEDASEAEIKQTFKMRRARREPIQNKDALVEEPVAKAAAHKAELHWN